MSSALHITFLHANGYPSGVYRQFFAALRQHATVHAPALLETAPDSAAHRRWPMMLDQALDALQALPADTSRKQSATPRHVLVGHSMGGYIALQAAARHIDEIRDVVLIDAPIPTGWRANVLTLAQLTGLAYKSGPAPIAARRRDTWPSREAAREFFAGKAFVQWWADGVLDDFIEHAIVDIKAGVTLKVPRDTERDIYAHIVHRSALKALRRLQRGGVNVSFIAGERSDELRLAGIEENERLFAPRFTRLPTGHLVPMEAPQACADAVLNALNN
jgi:pimeloyl-ACP methyl ester carboxylesterase